MDQYVTAHVVRTLQPLICGVDLITTEFVAMLWNGLGCTTPRHKLYCAEWSDFEYCPYHALRRKSRCPIAPPQVLSISDLNEGLFPFTGVTGCVVNKAACQRIPRVRRSGSLRSTTGLSALGTTRSPRLFPAVFQ